MGHGLGRDYVFEVPIYFGTEHQHVAYVKNLKEEYLAPLESLRASDPDYYEGVAVTFDRDRHYGWSFNHIVAWIGLYAIGRSIRGSLHSARARRVLRKNRQPIVERGKIFESKDFFDETSPEIYAVVLDELTRFASTDSRFKRRFVDLGPFRRIGPFVDWRGLLALDEKRPPWGR